MLQAGAEQAGRPGTPDPEPGAQLQDYSPLLRLHEGVGQEGLQVLFNGPRGANQTCPACQGG